MNPIAAVGIVLQRDGDGFSLLGSCFAFRRAEFFLTADHCVKDREANAIAVAVPPDYTIAAVLEITRHPSADVDVLRVDLPSGSLVDPFWDFVGNFSLGEEFFAYGFPEDVLGPDAGQPTQRLFRGHFQRFMEHQSRIGGYRYLAGELSIAAPPGLSGGPLFRPSAHQMVTGLVTENAQSTTGLESIEEEERDGWKRRTVHQTVISYGVAVMLSRISDWLDLHVPPRQTTPGGNP